MSSDPIHSAAASASDRRPAVWPWLLLPLVALTIFLALRTAKESHGPTHRADAAQSGSPSEDTGSR